MEETIKSMARSATLEVLKRDLLPNFLDPLPCDVTLRRMFDEANIPRFKANVQAKRGGGTIFYSVSHVEKWLRSRMLPARVAVELRLRPAIMC